MAGPYFDVLCVAENSQIGGMNKGGICVEFSCWEILFVAV